MNIIESLKEYVKGCSETPWTYILVMMSEGSNEYGIQWWEKSLWKDHEGNKFVARRVRRMMNI